MGSSFPDLTMQSCYSKLYLTPVLPYFLETDGLQKCAGGLPDQRTLVGSVHAC